MHLMKSPQGFQLSGSLIIQILTNRTILLYKESCTLNGYLISNTA